MTAAREPRPALAFRRMQAHRAVLAPAVLKQADLVDARVEQVPPLLPQPGLGITLAAEGLLGQAARRRERAVRLLELPCPGHRPTISLRARLSPGGPPWPAGRMPTPAEPRESPE